MKEKINRYKFDKISSVMAKEFGQIRRGEEENHSMLLMAMEGNLFKLHQMNEGCNGRHAMEAIHICLLVVQGYLEGKEYDLDPFLTDENRNFVNGLLMSFDPFTNDEVRLALQDQINLEILEDLRLYFEKPVICMLRIEKSIEKWTKEWGGNGYFIFLKNTLGEMIGN